MRYAFGVRALINLKALDVKVYHCSAKEGDVYVGSVRGEKVECKEVSHLSYLECTLTFNQNVYKIAVDLKSGQIQLKLKVIT